MVVLLEVTGALALRAQEAGGSGHSLTPSPADPPRPQALGQPSYRPASNLTDRPGSCRPTC